MRHQDIKKDIERAIKSFNKLPSRSHHHRELSFDFCHNYFRQNRGHLGGANMEMSCYVLWSYLASWGMLRGSSYLLQKNPAFLTKLVNLIDGKECAKLFDIDVDNYSNGKNIETILSCYTKIGETLKDNKREPSLTLITKIMLGVFGCVPAYDTYFKMTFNKLVKSGVIEGGGFSNSVLTKQSLLSISNFYTTYKAVVDEQRRPLFVRDFGGDATNIRYSIAKVIDMFGFNYSLSPVSGS